MNYKIVLTFIIYFSLTTNEIYSQWGDFFTTELQDKTYSDNKGGDIDDISSLEALSIRPYAGLAYVGDKPSGLIGVKLYFPIIKGEFFMGVKFYSYLHFEQNESNLFVKEKYDQATDFIDMLDFLQYGTRSSKYFFKIYNMPKTTLGYGNIMEDYDMQLMGHTYKKLGFEFVFTYQKNKIDFFLSDIKTLFDAVPSTLLGFNITSEPLDNFDFGFTFVSELNEYSIYKDIDGDNVPDFIDLYPTDKTLATDFDFWGSQKDSHYITKHSSHYWKKGWLPQQYIYERYTNIKTQDKTMEILNDKIVLGSIDTTINLFSLSPFLGHSRIPNEVVGIDSSNFVDLEKDRQVSICVGLNVGYNIIDEKMSELKVYGHASDMVSTSGLGFGLGLNYKLLRNFGTFIDLKVEGRFCTDKFLFSYYNSTYEIEKSIISKRPEYTYEDSKDYDKKTTYVYTKVSQLDRINQKMWGGHINFKINFFDYASLNIVGGLLVDVGKDPNFESETDSGPDTVDDPIPYENKGLKVTSYGIELELGRLLSPVIKKSKFYIRQNNHISRRGEAFFSEDNFLGIARPQTVFGIDVVLQKTNLGSLKINWNTPFIDKNANGRIDGWNESIKNISIIGVIIL